MKSLFAILVIGIFIISACKSGGTPSKEKDDFAKCITEKGATMYGTFWCPKCGRTKARFGSSFQYVNYVECDPRGDNEKSQLCLDKGIDKYDTWEFADGSRAGPEPSFDELSEKTVCIAPGK